MRIRQIITNFMYIKEYTMHSAFYLFSPIGDDENNLSVKKSKVSVHDRLGKQLSDDRKVVTKSKARRVEEIDDDEEEEEDNDRPSKKLRIDDRPKVRSSVADRVRPERRSSDELDQRNSKSGIQIIYTCIT